MGSSTLGTAFMGIPKGSDLSRIRSRHNLDRKRRFHHDRCSAPRAYSSSHRTHRSTICLERLRIQPVRVLYDDERLPFGTSDCVVEETALTVGRTLYFVGPEHND